MTWLPEAGIGNLPDVRFSNRPFGVKHFQTIHRCGVDVAHGLALLFGIGTKALPVWGSRARWNYLLGGLAVLQTVGQADIRTHLIDRLLHPACVLAILMAQALSQDHFAKRTSII